MLCMCINGMQVVGFLVFTALVAISASVASITLPGTCVLYTFMYVQYIHVYVMYIYTALDVVHFYCLTLFS